MEIWKPIPELNGKYECSNYGKVRRVNSDPRVQKYKILKMQTNKDGYIYVHCTLSYRKLVHRIVGQLFLDNPHNFKIINHKDLNKTNNHYNNLEWCTSSYNSQHANDNNRLGRMAWSVENIATGEVFNSVKLAANSLGIPYKYFHKKIYQLKEFKGFKLNEKTYRTLS